jgi:hypothetical protein
MDNSKAFLLLLILFVFYYKNLIMKNVIYLFAVSFFMTIVSCKDSIDDKLVVGNWVAAEFLENDVPKEVDLKSINFQFYNNKTYTFQGLMNKEAGNYRLQRDLLYSTDTLSDNRVEKSVKIIKITADSMFFEMNNGGISQIIKLHKTE